MSEKTIKKEAMPYQLYESDAIANHLNKMVEAGWAFTGFTPLFNCKYEAIPTDKSVHYAAIYTESTSGFSKEEKERYVDFINYANNAGWELLWTLPRISSMFFNLLPVNLCHLSLTLSLN